ncbi:complexed with cef1p [Aspergillus turcosus]|uniref:Complexed with cef1p n=1 Tax=Aspergillus turcosus TaxID=1245748 RepID=A0A229Z3Q0_9EURO|nr:complexed with cef1p [Aspergillus turcosus]RLL92957.1 complexed with cef1p [Aspergillus turcosus]
MTTDPPSIPRKGKRLFVGQLIINDFYPHIRTSRLGQGSEGEVRQRDLRAELLQAEAAHFAKKNGVPINEPIVESSAPKRLLEGAPDGAGEAEAEDPEAKRRRILEETRDIDADSEGSEDDSSEEESDDEDEAAELMRELEKIKRERLEQKEKEERERAAKEEEQREYDIARGNPLLNPQDFNLKRRWDDDVVFKNQARGTEEKRGKEFVNDLLRSDFHRRFMSKYVR